MPAVRHAEHQLQFLLARNAASTWVTVADDGPGIPEEDQEQIFQPFFTSKFSGTGLGLAVADNLVRRHGGRIELESAPGEGTTFFVILPLPEDAGGEEAS